jgi:transposase-like protein
VRDSHLIPGLKLRKYTDEHVRQVIDGYIYSRASYRRLPRCGPDNRRIPSKTAYTWVTRAALNCKSPLEVSIELRPKWGRFLELDAAALSLKGEWRSLLIAVNAETQDILHAKILFDEKDPRPISRFLEELRNKLGHWPEVIVIDDNPSLKKAVRESYPSVPLQLCVEHKWWTIDSKILPDRKLNENQRELKARIRAFLFAETLGEALAIIRFIMDNTEKWADSRSEQAIKSIREDFRELITHFKLDMKADGTEQSKAPRTTSIAEGIFGRLRMKVNQIRGFKSATNLPGLVNLIIMAYRATEFPGTQDRRGPLERADCKVQDWIRLCQKSKNGTAHS